jgi:large subunit ribosomal protein L11
MAKKKVAAVVKIQIEAGAATPAPPVGTALGPHGINIMDFCKAYNAETESMRGHVVPAEITVFEDRSFSFVTKTSPASALLKKAAGLEKASTAPRKEVAGSVTRAQVAEIAQTKLRDLNAVDLEGAIKQIEGTARSMGIEVVE